MDKQKIMTDAKSALRVAGDKLNLGLDQLGELAIAISTKKPSVPIELREILNEMFGDDVACMLPVEDLVLVIREFEERCEKQK